MIKNDDSSWGYLENRKLDLPPSWLLQDNPTKLEI